MQEYVYRYVGKNGETVYVGITNNMDKRVEQHTHDKLSVLRNPIIEYFAVENRCDAEILETYLINHYDTGKHYNVKKANRGDVSFLKDVEFPWVRYGSGDEPKKFHVKQNVVRVKEKVVFRNSGDSITSIIKEGDERVHEIMEECKAWEREIDDIKNHDIPAIERYIESVKNGEIQEDEKITLCIATENAELLNGRVNALSHAVEVLKSYPWSYCSKYNKDDLEDALDKATSNRVAVNEFYMKHFGIKLLS